MWKAAVTIFAVALLRPASAVNLRFFDSGRPRAAPKRQRLAESPPTPKAAWKLFPSCRCTDFELLPLLKDVDVKVTGSVTTRGVVSNEGSNLEYDINEFKCYPRGSVHRETFVKYSTDKNFNWKEEVELWCRSNDPDPEYNAGRPKEANGFYWCNVNEPKTWPMPTLLPMILINDESEWTRLFGNKCMHKFDPEDDLDVDPSSNRMCAVCNADWTNMQRRDDEAATGIPYSTKFIDEHCDAYYFPPPPKDKRPTATRSRSLLHRKEQTHRHKVGEQNNSSSSLLQTKQRGRRALTTPGEARAIQERWLAAIEHAAILVEEAAPFTNVGGAGEGGEGGYIYVGRTVMLNNGVPENALDANADGAYIPVQGFGLSQQMLVATPTTDRATIPFVYDEMAASDNTDESHPINGVFERDPTRSIIIVRDAYNNGHDLRMGRSPFLTRNGAIVSRGVLRYLGDGPLLEIMTNQVEWLRARQRRPTVAAEPIGMQEPTFLMWFMFNLQDGLGAEFRRMLRDLRREGSVIHHQLDRTLSDLSRNIQRGTASRIIGACRASDILTPQ